MRNMIQVDHSISGSIRVDQRKDEARRSEHTDLRVMIVLEWIKVRESGEKRIILERSKIITEIEKTCAKR